MEPLHRRTPLILSRFGRTSARRLTLKLENLQPVGSFKIRGIAALCLQLYAEGLRHFVRASGGNAGLMRRLGFASCCLCLACSGPDAAAPSGAKDAGGAASGDVETSITDAGWPDASAPNLRDDGLPPPWRWDEMAARVLDSATLAQAFAAAGVNPPSGTEIYAATVDHNALGLGFAYFEYGGGAFSQSFWPASTVKLLSSLAALDYIQSQGFTGAATVTWASGFSDVANAIVRRAIQTSSNEDYDRTIRIAGFDQLNANWLSPERGFPTAVIKASYAGFEVKNPPGYTLTEGTKSKVIPARSATGTYSCKSGGNNCANLFELTEAVRRVVWHADSDPADRFSLSEADRAGLEDALCTATPSFFEKGVEAALGSGARICHKPGWVPGSDSLDHGVLEAADGRRYMLGAAIPDPGDSSSQAKLAQVAEHSLNALSTLPKAPFYLQRDAGKKIVIEASPGTLRIFSSGADALELYIDGSAVPLAPADADGIFVALATAADYADKLISMRAFSAGSLSAVRNVVLSAPK